jgi:hypothetical protein
MQELSSPGILKQVQDSYQKDYKLSHYETLCTAIEIQRNRQLALAF